jgi:hypothetical protein
MSDYNGPERRNIHSVFEQVIRDSEAIIYIKATLEEIKMQMSEICKIAKSEDGFVRCKSRNDRIKSLERYKWYLVTFVIGTFLTVMLEKVL